MELTQLNQFRLVAETENIVDASNILNISQPALTKSIKNLENELNVALFDRTNHKLVLNEHGKQILDYVNDIFSDLNDMTTDLKFLGLENNIKICSSINAIVSFITPKLANQFPDIHFYHQFRNIQKFKSYIEQEIFDLAISSGEISSNIVANHFFFRDTVLISVPETNPLYSKQFLKLKDLNGSSFVNQRDTIHNPLPALFESMLAAQGINLRRIYMNDIFSLTNILINSDLLSYTSIIGSISLDYGPHRRNIPIDPNEHAYLNYYLSYLLQNEEKVAVYVAYLKDLIKQYTISM